MDSKQDSENPTPTAQSSANPAGRFIAIEGVDGSGKATQSKLLAEHLRSLGHDVLEIDFPRYGRDSAYYIERYLNGDYGSSSDVPPDLGVLPYAIDRFAAKNEITEHLNKPGSYVIADRYMASNLAHQGAKIEDPAMRHAFYERTLKLEYDILGIPRPDLNIVLLLPPTLAQENIDKKAPRSYMSTKRDIHEADSGHLEKANYNYEEICKLYPGEFIPVNCIDDSGNQYSAKAIYKTVNDLVIV